MKTAFLITARLKSTRLPRKLLREVEGRPIFAHMLDRLKLARRLDKIVVCTSTNAQDDPLEELAGTEGVECFRGHEDDVILRLRDAAHWTGADYVLNITGDCPFVDPYYADRIVTEYERTGADLIRAWNLPHGAYSYGLAPAALDRVVSIKDDVNTEVWLRYFSDTDAFVVHDLPIENPRHRRPDLRMTLDYPEDLEFVEAVFRALGRDGRVFSLDDILNFLDTHTDVVELNRQCAVAYKARYDAQSAIRLKPRHDVRKAVVVGSGSIGQRHIRNLKTLGVGEVVALRTLRGHTQQLDPGLDVREIHDWSELEKEPPDIAVVSNPSRFHAETALRLIPHVKGLLVEKPFAMSVEEARAVASVARSQRVVPFVAYNLRFHSAVRVVLGRLRDGVLGRPLVLQAQVGSWLPDWHPGEDYRTSYAAREEFGGGVLRTLVHEIDLAQHLLGPAAAVVCLTRRHDDLVTDVEAIADVMLKHEGDAVSQIHLDYVQRPFHRRGIVSCERGSIEYDLVRPQVVVRTPDNPAGDVVFSNPDLERNTAYLEELATFLQYVREGRVRHEHDFVSATRNVAVVEAALRSAGSGTLIRVES